ncbi:MAG: TIGR04086 family membrane protein [Ruminococcaceae bacterium]|nr:TIGR04086 family membrane protein [Oscillospiraceae bacterium]
MKKQVKLPEGFGNKGFYLIGSLLGVAVAVLLMLISAFVILKFDLDRQMAAPFATVCVSAGAFVAAFYNAFKLGGKGYIVGLVTGGIVFAVVLIISLMVAENSFSLNTLFHFIIMMLSGLIGGIWGVNRKLSKKFI